MGTTASGTKRWITGAVALLLLGAGTAQAREPRRSRDDSSSQPPANSSPQGGSQRLTPPASGGSRSGALDSGSRSGRSEFRFSQPSGGDSRGSQAPGSLGSRLGVRQGGTPPSANSPGTTIDRSRVMDRFRQPSGDSSPSSSGLDAFRNRGSLGQSNIVPRQDGSRGSAPDGALLDRLRQRGLGTQGDSSSGLGRGRLSGQDATLPGLGSRLRTDGGRVISPGSTTPPTPGLGRGSIGGGPGGAGVPGGGSSNLSDIRKRIRDQGLPGASQGPAGKLPELIPPGQAVDSARDRKNRLGDMQNRILRDPDSRPRTGDLGGGALRNKGLELDRSKGLQIDRDRSIGSGRSKGLELDRAKGDGFDRSRHADVRFSDRDKAGHFEAIKHSPMAKNMKLDEQFRLRNHGDVARRMDLYQHGLPHVRDPHMAGVYATMGLHYYGHHGPVGPHYMAHCFQHFYFGPAFFPAFCWYPVWDPWVDWCWRYRCHPYWDPRPIWCQPVYYDPCPVWIYYQMPVWTPLPVVTSGTWVDVPPVAAASPCDLQLLALRFVEPGHPEEKLGPRYRVWFRNNSDRPVTQPFNVLLLAANDANLVAGLPQAGLRVTSIEAGDTQSVDVRLPIEATTMARDPQGNPAPFNVVHVLVDAHRETSDALRDNNGAQVVRSDILPVDPSTFDVKPLEVQPGGDVLVAGEGFGPGPGRVVFFVGGQELEGQILGWYDLGIRVSLPNQAVAAPTPAELVVVRSDGAAANPAKITLLSQ